MWHNAKQTVVVQREHTRHRPSQQSPEERQKRATSSRKHEEFT